MFSATIAIPAFFGLTGNGIRDTLEGHPIRGAVQAAPLAYATFSQLSHISEFYRGSDSEVAVSESARFFIFNAVGLGAAYVSQGLSDLSKGQYKEGALKLFLTGSAIAFLQSYSSLGNPTPLVATFAAGALSFAGRKVWNLAPQIKASISSTYSRLTSAIQTKRAEARANQDLLQAHKMV